MTHGEELALIMALQTLETRINLLQDVNAELRDRIEILEHDMPLKETSVMNCILNSAEPKLK